MTNQSKKDLVIWVFASLSCIGLIARGQWLTVILIVVFAFSVSFAIHYWEQGKERRELNKWKKVLEESRLNNKRRK
jgi:hypothetical protein